MCNLNDLFEAATALRKRYIEENDPHKDFKVEILSQIIAECFRAGEIPMYIELKYLATSNTDLMSAVAIDLFDLLSIKIQCKCKDKFLIFLLSPIAICLSYN